MEIVNAIVHSSGMVLINDARDDVSQMMAISMAISNKKKINK